VVKETVVVEGTPQVVEKVVTATPVPEGKVEIVYYDRTNSAPKWADKYNEVQDKVTVKVEIQPPGTRYEQLIAAIMAGNAPDVIGLDCVQVGRFAQLGALVPLEDMLPQEAKDSYFPSLINVEGHYGRYGGHIVGVPFWVDNSVCCYNKKFLEEAGGDPEVGIRSWDDYINYGKAAVERLGIFGLAMLGKGGGIEFLYWPWIWAQGGDFTNKEWTASTANTPEVEKTFQFIRDIVTKHKITNDCVGVEWSDAWGLFTSQKAMAAHQGGGAVGHVRSEFPELWEIFGVCPIPGPKEGQKSSFIGGNVASLSTQSKRKEEAFDFLLWLTFSDEGMSVTGEIGFLPGCPKAFDLPVYKKDAAIYAPYKEGLQTGWASSNHPRYDEVMAVMQVAFNDAAREEKSIDQIVNETHEEIDRILKR